ncbi:MAG TPA: MBOAT family O-acyltransferase [Pirellulales bacterium]|nr:MBOAT family O-acyltransferase [Pirellulales bacterium]
MDRSPLDLYKPDFWYTLAIAVLVLVPLKAPVVRKWAWAAINLAFLGVLLGVPDLWGPLQRQAYLEAARMLGASDLLRVCACLFVAYIVLQAVQRRWLGVIPLALAGLALATLFTIHKLPSTASVYRLADVKSALGAIGFSYAALRLVDALRLTHEGRHAAPDLPSTINYLLPFHMLAAGPIQGYADFMAQPAVPPPLGASDALRAVERIALGLFKKYVIADLLESSLLTPFPTPFVFGAFEVMLFYFLLYLDFSAYSDITVGAGRLMGVATPENFNRPYVARNLVDFWDRWHMSLSQFIYRNIFIPVQMALVRRTGPKSALWCGAVAFLVSFLLCGLWHSLDVRWAMWGMMHALGLVVVVWYRAWLKRRLGREAMNRYRAHLGIRLLAVVLTQAYVAVTLQVVTWPLELST